MKERGVVTKIDGRAAVVRFAMGEGCAHCDSSESCAVNDRALETELAEGLDVAVGDYVEVDVPAKAQLAGMLWLVALPLALFGAAYLGARGLGWGEGPSALGGILGFGLGLASAALMSRKGAMARRPRVVGLATLPGNGPDQAEQTAY